MLKTLMRVLLSACLLFQFGLAQAQDYPSRPVKLLVPFPPGGPTDVLARLVAQKLTDTLGQSFIVLFRRQPAGTGPDFARVHHLGAPKTGGIQLRLSRCGKWRALVFRDVHEGCRVAHDAHPV